MTSATNLDTDLTPFPDHTQLPKSNATWQEHPQSILLTNSITPILQLIAQLRSLGVEPEA